MGENKNLHHRVTMPTAHLHSLHRPQGHCLMQKGVPLDAPVKGGGGGGGGRGFFTLVGKSVRIQLWLPALKASNTTSVTTNDLQVLLKTFNIST